MLPIDFSTYSVNSLVLSGILGVVIGWAKQSKNPNLDWISDKTPQVARLVSVMIASLSAAGMTLSYSPTGDGTYTATVTGISAASALTFGWQIISNYFLQFAAEKTLVDKKET